MLPPQHPPIVAPRRLTGDGRACGVALGVGEIIEKKKGAVGIFDPAGSVFYLFFCFIFFGFHSFEDHFVAVVSVVEGTVYSADGCG